MKKSINNNFANTFLTKQQLIANMDEPMANEVVKNTEFLDTGAVRVLSGDNNVPTTYRTENSDISDFLGTPRYITSVVYSNLTAANTALWTYPSTDFIALADVQNKLKGRGMIRATFCVKVVVNASPFQAGQLMLHFLPPCTGSETLSRNVGLMTKSQQPHVYFDLSTDGDSAILKMPYVSPLQYYDMMLQLHPWGTFTITAVTSLYTGAAATLKNAELSMFVWLEDIELAQPMVSNGKKDISAKEGEFMAKGTISTGLRTAAKVASALSAIPALTAYCAPAAWVAERLACTAAEFGFSKPEADRSYEFINAAKYRYAATGDGSDDSFQLSMRRDNAVSVVDNITFRTEDEMSLNFLKQVEFYWRAYNLTTADTPGTQIFNSNITIQNYTNGTYASGALTATYRESNPLYMLSTLFSLWRGSLVLRLKFVKTQYHSGRILIVWRPSNSLTLATSLTTSTYCLREVVDLRFEDEIEIHLPWIIAQDYLGYGDAFGYLEIKVLNQIKAPDGVSDTVPVLMFLRGGNDVEFAVPKSMAIPGTPLLYGNSGAEIMDKPAPVRMLSAERCVGETFTSIKQLTNRNSLVCMATAPAADANLKVCPWFHGAVTTNAGVKLYAYGGDYMSLIGTMYKFYRGSVRIAVKSTMSSDVIATIIDKFGNFIAPGHNIPLNAAGDWTTGQYCPNGHLIIEPTDGDYLQVKIPYYNSLRCTALYPNTSASTTAIVEPSEPDTAVNFYGCASAATTQVFRSTGEDFQYGYFLGCLPYLVSLA